MMNRKDTENIQKYFTIRPKSIENHSFSTSNQFSLLSQLILSILSTFIQRHSLLIP